MDQCMRWKLFILIKTCIFIIYWVWERIQTQWHESASACPLIKQMVRFTWFPSLPILCCDTAVHWLVHLTPTSFYFGFTQVAFQFESCSLSVQVIQSHKHLDSLVGPGCIQLKHCSDPKWCNRIEVWYQCHIFHTADQRWYLNLKGT